MVECEYKYLPVTEPLKVVLIDTWWNVNNEKAVIVYAQGLVLIDTWWNVNITQTKLTKTRMSF